MKKIPLEDNFTDVIGKAQRGLGIADSELAEKAQISPGEVRRLRDGEVNKQAISRVATVLGLAARPLSDLASGNWSAPEIESPNGFAMFNTPYHDVTVNAFLAWDPQTKRGVAFDTGATCDEMLATIKREGVKVDLILLTHSHPDHIAALDALRAATNAPIYLGERESVSGAQPIAEGKEFAIDALKIRTLLTWGHSQGGVTYFVEGLARPLAIVGDSIFAGSMGGGMVSYKDALRNNREKILALPNETIICPGHGPLTTVGNEQEQNPFFAAKLNS